MPSFIQYFESATTSNPATPTVTSGNFLVCVYTYDGSSPVFSDGFGDTPTVIHAELVGADGGKTQVIGYAVTSSAAASVGMTQTGGSFWIVMGEEVSGQYAPDPVDNERSEIIDAQTTSFSRSLTLGNTNDLVVAYAGEASGQGQITTAGYTTDGGTTYGNAMAHKTIAASGSTTVDFNNTNWPGPAISSDAIIVAIQGSATPGGTSFGGPTQTFFRARLHTY